MIIDTHAHVVPATLLDAMRSEKRLFPSVKLHDAAAPRMEFGGGGPGRPIQPRLHDLGAAPRLADEGAGRPAAGRRLDRCLRLRSAGRGGRRLGALLQRAHGKDAAALPQLTRARDRAAAGRRARRPGARRGARRRVSRRDDRDPAERRSAAISTTRRSTRSGRWPRRARPRSSCTRITSAATSGSPATI